MTSKWFWRKFTPRNFRTFVGEANSSAHAQEAELQKRRGYKRGGATKEVGPQKEAGHKIGGVTKEAGILETKWRPVITWVWMSALEAFERLYGTKKVTYTRDPCPP